VTGKANGHINGLIKIASYLINFYLLIVFGTTITENQEPNILEVTPFCIPPLFRLNQRDMDARGITRSHDHTITRWTISLEGVAYCIMIKN
jgi:hypothetical protein